MFLPFPLYCKIQIFFFAIYHILVAKNSRILLFIYLLSRTSVAIVNNRVNAGISITFLFLILVSCGYEETVLNTQRFIYYYLHKCAVLPWTRLRVYYKAWFTDENCFPRTNYADQSACGICRTFDILWNLKRYNKNYLGNDPIKIDNLGPVLCSGAWVHIYLWNLLIPLLFICLQPICQ